MNMMTLDEMKLAMCEKLPELIVWRHGEKMSIPYHREGFFWRGLYDDNNLFREIHWPTEGLQVCHEAEKLLTTGEAIKYVKELSAILDKQLNTKSTWEIACTINEESVCCAIASYVSATYEQRLEALCRVWFPERF